MRIPTQLVHYILTTIGRSIQSAHKNIVKKHGTKSTQHAKFTQAHTISNIETLKLEEAMKIMSFEDTTRITPKVLEDRFQDLYNRNDPKVGGCDYLQAKYKNAYDTISKEVIKSRNNKV